MALSIPADEKTQNTDPEPQATAPQVQPLNQQPAEPRKAERSLSQSEIDALLKSMGVG
jgi:hypothetical protein